MPKNICVYCASSVGHNPEFAVAAKQLANELVKRDIGLVYGGGAIGLMGIIADEVMDLGGRVVGVIPKNLFDKEVAHHQITELIQVKDMHERKALMIERSDAFIAMPGGFGTLEELAEVLTWRQIGVINKPIGVLNVHGYYDSLLTWFHTAVDKGLLNKHYIDELIVCSESHELVTLLTGR